MTQHESFVLCCATSAPVQTLCMVTTAMTSYVVCRMYPALSMEVPVIFVRIKLTLSVSSPRYFSLGIDKMVGSINEAGVMMCNAIYTGHSRGYGLPLTMNKCRRASDSVKVKLLTEIIRKAVARSSLLSVSELLIEYSCSSTSLETWDLTVD